MADLSHSFDRSASKLKNCAGIEAFGIALAEALKPANPLLSNQTAWSAAAGRHPRPSAAGENAETAIGNEKTGNSANGADIKKV